MTTPILGITEVAQSQINKEAAINAATRALENATQRRLEVEITGDTDLGADDYTRNFFFELTGTPGPFTLTIPSTERAFYVLNNTDGIATIATGTPGVTVDIANGEGRLLYNNGIEDVVEIGGGAGGGGASDVSIAAFFAGTGVDEDAELVYVLTKNIDIETDFGASQAYAETADATGVDIDVQLNNVSIGTISFGAGLNVATFVATADVAVAGDRIKFVMPSSLGTLAGIAINLLFPLTA